LLRDFKKIAYLVTCSISLWLTCGNISTLEAKNSSNRLSNQTPLLRPNYKIDLKLDYDARSYTGKQHLRWTNNLDRPSSFLYFHLYTNRGASLLEHSSSAREVQINSEPRIDIVGVRNTPGQSLQYLLNEEETMLRVSLGKEVKPGESFELELEFKGTIPELDTEETGLVAHVLQQVNAVLRREREFRKARDINFSCRGMMLLGSFYPVVAVKSSDDWKRKADLSVGDYLFAETSNYDVTIETQSLVKVFTSGEEVSSSNRTGKVIRRFKGENLREFSLVAGRTLLAEERSIDGLIVRSIFMAGHEVVGKRVLTAASNAVRIYTKRFGQLPFKTINIAEAPLVAGLGSAEFSGLSIIASAFYVDFDSASMRSVPEVVKEQRASVEDSLEFTVAHMIAHQWWGSAIGTDPERIPILDESLANWSALLYYKELYDEERYTQVLDDQLRGVYKIYRTFGGEDMEADKASREYKNSFQYSAIVFSKGALMLLDLRQLLGDERFFNALRSYYSANLREIAELEDLRGAFVAESPLQQRRLVTRTFNRWLSEKRGDLDISSPDPQLAAGLGITIDPSKNNDSNAFAKLGKFFWRQMTRIR
jgi:hypothetical protein